MCHTKNYQIERGILGLDLISAHPGGDPAKFPEFFRRRPLEDPDGTQNGGQMFDFTKKVDPSRSPVGADRSEIKCYIGRCAVRPFLRPWGSKTHQKKIQNLDFGPKSRGMQAKSMGMHARKSLSLSALRAGLLVKTASFEETWMSGQELLNHVMRMLQAQGCALFP